MCKIIVPQQLAIRNSIQTFRKMQLAFCNTNWHHFVVAAACAFKSWLIGLFLGSALCNANDREARCIIISVQKFMVQRNVSRILTGPLKGLSIKFYGLKCSALVMLF